MFQKIKKKLNCNFDSFSVIDKILPRLSHNNPAVTFGAIKVIIKFLDFIESPGLVNNLYKKLCPSIVSLVSWQGS